MNPISNQYSFAGSPISDQQFQQLTQLNALGKAGLSPAQGMQSIMSILQPQGNFDQDMQLAGAYAQMGDTATAQKLMAKYLPGQGVQDGSQQYSPQDLSGVSSFGDLTKQQLPALTPNMASQFANIQNYNPGLGEGLGTRLSSAYQPDATANILNMLFPALGTAAAFMNNEPVKKDKFGSLYDQYQQYLPLLKQQ